MSENLYRRLQPLLPAPFQERHHQSKTTHHSINLEEPSPNSWLEALQQRFPNRWRELAQHVGDGLRELLESSEDLKQATENANNSLLAYKPVTADEMQITGARLLNEVIQPLEEMANT